jgi:hypothetical protein
MPRRAGWGVFTTLTSLGVALPSWLRETRKEAEDGRDDG